MFMGERERGEHQHQNISIAKLLSNCIPIPYMYCAIVVYLSKSFSIQYVLLYLLKYDEISCIWKWSIPKKYQIEN